MSLLKKINDFFNGYDDEDQFNEEDMDIQENDFKTFPKKSNMTIMKNSKHGNISKKIMVFEPHVFSDVKKISGCLLDGEAVIINFERIDDQQTHRVVDFLSGVVFAIDGKIERIGEEIFLCTPPDFNVESDIMTSDKIRDF